MFQPIKKPLSKGFLMIELSFLVSLIFSSLPAMLRIAMQAGYFSTGLLTKNYRCFITFHIKRGAYEYVIIFIMSECRWDKDLLILTSFCPLFFEKQSTYLNISLVFLSFGLFRLAYPIGSLLDEDLVLDGLHLHRVGDQLGSWLYL